MTALPPDVREKLEALPRFFIRDTTVFPMDPAGYHNGRVVRAEDIDAILRASADAPAALPCDDIRGTCDEYPACPCGRAWKEHEGRLRAERRAAAPAPAAEEPVLLATDEAKAAEAWNRRVPAVPVSELRKVKRFKVSRCEAFGHADGVGHHPEPDGKWVMSSDIERLIDEAEGGK